MTFPRDHHPSELLRPLLRGELSEREASQVEAHLHTCAQCRSERRALEMLLGDLPPMDDVERARLRRNVAEALSAPARPAATAPPRWAPRFAPVLGAAATIALLVAGVAWLGTLGDLDGDEMAVTEGEPAEAPDEPDRFDQREAEEVAPDAVEPAAERGAPAAGTLTKGGPEPVFRADAGALRASALRRFGSTGALFRSFASAYETRAATPERQEMFVDSLVRRAPDPGAGAQIRACAETVLSDPPGAVLPAYGATGTFGERPALALGFVFAAEPGPLDRFMFWVWPVGECASILHYEAGRIRP